MKSYYAAYTVIVVVMMALIAGLMLHARSDEGCWIRDAQGGKEFYDYSRSGCDG